MIVFLILLKLRGYNSISSFAKIRIYFENFQIRAFNLELMCLKHSFRLELKPH